MTPRRLPPLNGIRAFDAVARHLNYKQAAAELFVTTTAISHRITNLENFLGVSLFDRLPHRLRLTPEGEAYLPKVAEAFRLLAEAQLDLARDCDNQQLVLSATMSFASNWLLPRLPSFKAQHPDLSVHLEGSDTVTDLSRSNTDVAIRYGFIENAEYYSQPLFTDQIMPVCTPDLAKTIKTPTDLLQLPCAEYRWAHFGGTDPSWQKWFETLGHGGVSLGQLEVFNEEHMAIAHALSGRAVALVSIVAAQDHLSTGRLVCPFDHFLRSKTHYFLCRKQLLREPKIASFLNWITVEAASFYPDQAVVGRSTVIPLSVQS